MKESTKQAVIGWFYLISGVILIVFAYDLAMRAEDALGMLSTFVGCLGILVGAGELLELQNKKLSKKYKDR